VSDGDIRILTGAEVSALLRGREHDVVEAIRAAYVAHARHNSSLPHSTFLRFPGNTSNRIIALPAYLGPPFDLAGMKWIASFPGNLRAGVDRASAVLVLNSMETGRPELIMEGSVISAQRTAGSAALAARALYGSSPPDCLGLIGCGLINFEILRFLTAVYEGLRSVVVHDIRREHALRFASRARVAHPSVEISVADHANDVIGSAPLLSFATTASEPHTSDPTRFRPGGVILHVSLRDLSPEVILAGDNVVDDVDHVCRADTSVHRAEQKTGNRSFIRCTLADVLQGDAPAREGRERTLIFSPFGLGVLDLAVGKLVQTEAGATGAGTLVPGFLPPAWIER